LYGGLDGEQPAPSSDPPPVEVNLEGQNRLSLKSFVDHVSVRGLAALALLAGGGFGANAFAAGDMLQPDEIQTTGISANPANDSGVFIGAGLGFGQARTTEAGASPGLGYLLSFEPGYQFHTGSWSRLEFSGQIFTGRLGLRVDEDLGGKLTLPINFGALVKAGYGFSLGDKVFGVLRAGVGPVQSDWKGDIGGATYESSSALNGVAAMVGYSIVAPMTHSLDLTGGITWMHMQFDLGKVKSGSSTVSLDRPLIVNIPQAELGLRFRL
jgi:hypothetical protein